MEVRIHILITRLEYIFDIFMGSGRHLFEVEVRWVLKIGKIYQIPHGYSY